MRQRSCSNKGPDSPNSPNFNAAEWHNWTSFKIKYLKPFALLFQEQIGDGVNGDAKKALNGDAKEALDDLAAKTQKSEKFHQLSKDDKIRVLDELKNE